MPKPALTRHVTFANTCALLALVVALGAGTATAANTIRSKDIANGQVKTVDLHDRSVTSAKVQDGTLGGVDVLDGSLTASDLASDAITATQLRDGSVGTSELQLGAVTGSQVADDSLSFADLASGGTAGSVSVPAGDVPDGQCEQKTLSIAGAETGDAVVFSVRGAVQPGVFFVATQVSAPSTALVQLCNLSGTTMEAISGLPVRVLTFH
ncbi:hypothetical protein G5V58_01800 [Nocardioides anomalus]|uniref:Uncharacterized protein n=1 Tax=Nocardioides anomalus TaxID=2712223 RepID=A0A6G6W8X7_9ACTN|nr:hypothetical protein [Nocardioides anomalus]QIG41672.1 hypothetical protein G5V58_01800 [Nocardioides anomalus]